MSLRWIPDHDDAHSVDDLTAKGVDVRLERMDRGYYWLCIYDGAEEHHFDLSVPARSRTKIRAFARQPAPEEKKKSTPKQVREDAALILSAAAGSDGFRKGYGLQQIAEWLGIDGGEPSDALKLALSALFIHGPDAANAEAAIKTGWTP